MTAQVLGTLGLTLAYVVLAVLLLNLNLRSRWHWTIKSTAVVITSAFYILSYLALQGLLGWPVRQKPPRHLELVAVHIQEPDKQAGEDGWIYLWLKPQAHNQAPRAYAFPYTSAFHEVALSAAKKLDRGIRQLGEYEKQPEGVMAKVEDSSRLGQEFVPIVFYDPPDPLFPAEK